MKKKIVLLVVGVLIIIFIITTILTKGNFEKKLIRYIGKSGYSLDSGTLYYKEDEKNPLNKCNGDNLTLRCVGIAYYFDISAYQLYKTKVTVNESSVIEFRPQFDYKNRELTYEYQVSYANGLVILTGEYDTKNKDYTCEISYVHGMDLEKSDSDICEPVKEDIEVFYYEALTLIKDSSLLKKMQK